ncbi:site-specific integrase [Corynebacterium gallinarum]|uniref:Site-specific integrase n=1 Tax=Corynebacterium gallinarum TaxID=2762214 RepID=A0A8I0LBJ3_9CORY|nr:site-specific integrase [Corynebacterium gallinarum]MBD8030932.1 site-specific integrase [Corynebacterium gallinarum]
MSPHHFTDADYARIIMNYTPASVRAEVWADTEDFVRSVVRSLGIDAATTSRDTLRNILSAVAKLSAWVWTRYGAVSLETVFHPSIIGDYFESPETKPLSRTTVGTQRSLLMRIGEAVNPEWSADFQHPVTYEPALAAYGTRDIQRFTDWASSQPTSQRRENFHTVLSLTLGAGLRAGEICTLRAKDVCRDPFGIIVHPHGFRGAPRRAVPLHLLFHQHIDAVLEQRGFDDYIFRPGRTNENVGQLSAYLRRATLSTATAAPDARRLRNTWIKSRILSGVPEDVICAAAGLRSLAQFEEYVLEAGRSRAQNFRFMLQGGRSPTPPVCEVYGP